MTALGKKVRFWWIMTIFGCGSVLVLPGSLGVCPKVNDKINSSSCSYNNYKYVPMLDKFLTISTDDCKHTNKVAN